MNTLKIYTASDFSKDLKLDSSLRLFFMLKGELSFHAGTVIRHLYIHDFSFIMPYEMYGDFSPSDRCRAYIIEVPPELWENICPDADKIRFSIGVLKSNDISGSYSSICQALARIHYHSSYSDPSALSRICGALCDIIAVLTENYLDQSSVRSFDQTSENMQNILRYISSNYSHKISLEDIAGKIGFHPQYFSSYFKKLFNINFTDYLNNYRVEKSTSMLRNTKDSILNISVACGFNNHKTFSNAFEKRYGMTPGKYRKAVLSASQSIEEDNHGEDFDYLRYFWNKDDPKTPHISSSSTKVSIILRNDRILFENRSKNIISLGRALSCLRSDMRAQITYAKKDLDLEYVRIRDIFSDDLFVYYEDSSKTPIISWRSIDEILDFLISEDLKPFIELGYMPGQLASRKQFAGWQYHPNVSSPKSPELWSYLTENFIRHLLSRYGRSEVEEWLFDFWTSPNLPIENGYWNESMENFFRFYKITYDAVRRSDAELKFGSPNFSYPGGLSWYRSFFKYAGEHNISPDFISIHLYGCDDGLFAEHSSFMKFSVFDNNFTLPNLRPERDNIPEAIRSLKALINEKTHKDIPIVVDDWNVSFWPFDYTRDICFMAPFIIDNYFNSCSDVLGMGFASLSDIHEDFFNTDQLYNGGPGLLTYTGIPKASYHALGMAYRFTRRILKRGDNYVIGKTEQGYELLIYNLDFYNQNYKGNDPLEISLTNRYTVFENIPDLDCHVEINADAGSYSLIRTGLTTHTGSSYDVWARMGSPSDITPEITDYLRRASAPEMSCRTLNVTDKIILDEIVEPHSVIHIEIRRL